MLISSIIAPAQSSIFNNPNNESYFGLRIGADIACPGNITIDNFGISTFKVGGGIEFGGIYNIPVVANFYIEPGFKLFYDTYSIKDDYIKAIGNGIKSMSIEKFGMRIPIMAGYHFDFTDDIKVSVFTGPELEVGFYGNGETKGKNIKVSENIYNEDGGMNRVNLLWSIGAGISYKHFYLGVNGGIGMLNMLNNDYAKMHENRVSLNLGYNF